MGHRTNIQRLYDEQNELSERVALTKWMNDKMWSDWNGIPGVMRTRGQFSLAWLNIEEDSSFPFIRLGEIANKFGTMDTLHYGESANIWFVHAMDLSEGGSDVKQWTACEPFRVHAHWLHVPIDRAYPVKLQTWIMTDYILLGKQMRLRLDLETTAFFAGINPHPVVEYSGRTSGWRPDKQNWKTVAYHSGGMFDFYQPTLVEEK